MNGSKLSNFFKSDAHIAHYGGEDTHALRRPGIRAKLAVLGAALALFASTALTSPAFAQDAPKEPAAVEQVASDSVTVTTPDKFAEDVITASSDKPVVLYIYSPDCHYCERYGPVLQMEAEANKDVNLVKLNIDAYPEFAWGLFDDMQGVPTVAVFAHGFFISKTEGAPPEGQEFEAAQAVVNYADEVWHIVGDQLKEPAPDNTSPTPAKQQPARNGM